MSIKFRFDENRKPVLDADGPYEVHGPMLDENFFQTCEACPHTNLKPCRYCELTGELNPEAFTRKELIEIIIAFGERF